MVTLIELLLLALVIIAGCSILVKWTGVPVPVECPHPGAIDDYLGWSEGEWD